MINLHNKVEIWIRRSPVLKIPNDRDALIPDVILPYCSDMIAALLWSDLRTILTPICNMRHPGNIRSNSFLTQFLDVAPCNLYAMLLPVGIMMKHFIRACDVMCVLPHKLNNHPCVRRSQLDFHFGSTTHSLVRFLTDYFSQFSFIRYPFLPSLVTHKISRNNYICSRC